MKVTFQRANSDRFQLNFKGSIVQMSREGVLTEEIVLSKSKANSLAEVKNLNLWGLKLEDVTVVRKIPNVETIALSVNSLVSLEPFSHCPNLKELYLRRNNISSFDELAHLRKLAELRVLWLTDNPITKDAKYRSFTIATLPQLTKLDEVDIKPEEREEAAKAFPRPAAPTRQPAPAPTPPPAPVAAEARPNVPAATPAPSVKGNHILEAINLLIQDLDKESLQRLHSSIGQLIGKH
jgi:Leucine-rich repeat (LRR) protein